MASEDVLDIAQLVAAIPGDNPAGEDLREDFSPDSIYRQIRAARSEAREAERRVVFDDEEDVAAGAAANWRPILELAPQALSERSKDLEVTALLIEALVREHGFPGLRDGYRLARELVEQFWDNLYPLPDEDDGMFARVAPLAGLNGNEGEGLLIRPIAKVIITEGTDFGPFSSLDYKMANDLEAEPDAEKRARRIAQPGTVTKQMFEKAVSATSAEFFKNLLEDIQQCRDEFQALSDLLDEKCGVDESGYSQAPPSSSIREVLEECHEAVVAISRHLLEVEEESSEDALETTGGNGGGISTQVHTREEAFRALLRAADFFKRTEPHSPVSYALEQAVSWGRMSLPDLLKELIADETARSDVFKRVGIQPPEEEETTY